MQENLKRRVFRTILGAALFSGSVFGYKDQIQTTYSAITTIPDCKETMVDPFKYDSIVIFGIDQNPDIFSAEISDLINAAVNTYNLGLSSNIVFVGQIPRYKETQIFKNVKSRILLSSRGSKNIERSNVNFINHSVSFGQAMEQVKIYMYSKNQTSVLGISNWYYVNRLNVLNRNFGNGIIFSASECLTWGMSEIISKDVSETQFAEKLEIVELLLDRQGKVPTLIKKLVKDLK